MLYCPYCLRDKNTKYEMSCELKEDEQDGTNTCYIYKCSSCAYSESHEHKIDKEDE